MSAGHYLLLVLIYLFIHVLLYYHCSNLFRTVYKLSCLIFRRTFSLEFYNYEIQNFVYWRQNFQICRTLFLALFFLFVFFFFHSPCITNYVTGIMQVFWIDFETVWLVFCSSFIHFTNHKIKSKISP